MRIQLTPEQVAGKVRENNAKARGAIHKGQWRAAERARTFLVRATPKVDTGQLKASWRVDRGATIQLVNHAPHAGIIEAGARPHKVSMEGFYAIFRWAKRHGAGGPRGGGPKPIYRADVSYINGMPFAPEDVPAARLAMGIVRKLAKEGQKPTWYVKKSMKTIQAMTVQEVAKALSRAVGSKGNA